jgi:hypothetical protein
MPVIEHQLTIQLSPASTNDLSYLWDHVQTAWS